MRHSIKNDLNKIKEITSQRGFILLSKKLYNVDYIYRWKCQDGHFWKTTAYNIVKGGKCPRCSRGLNEEKTRFIFEQFTSKKFPTDWKILGNRLQLDGYCKELNLAFEYQGIQHYKRNNMFHKTEIAFINLQKRDKCKSERCNQKGIIKVDVPYTESASKSRLESFIIKNLLLHNVPIINTEVNWNEFIRYTSKLNKLKIITAKRGIALLDKQYLGSHYKHSWQCTKCKHIWEAVAKDVRDKSGCPKCAGHVSLTLKQVILEAKKLGFNFLSSSYKNAHTKYEWQCVKCKHTKISHYNSMQQGSGCPKCSQNLKMTMDDIKQAENKRNITFLSKKIINSSYKYKWVCNICGYKWKTAFSCIKHKTGCPQCAIEKKKVNKSDLDQLAADRGLICLSEKCIGNYEKHLWKCIKCQQVLSLKPTNVRRGTCCRKCKSILKSLKVHQED